MLARLLLLLGLFFLDKAALLVLFRAHHLHKLLVGELFVLLPSLAVQHLLVEELAHLDDLFALLASRLDVLQVGSLIVLGALSHVGLLLLLVELLVFCTSNLVAHALHHNLHSLVTEFLLSKAVCLRLLLLFLADFNSSNCISSFLLEKNLAFALFLLVVVNNLAGGVSLSLLLLPLLGLLRLDLALQLQRLFLGRLPLVAQLRLLLLLRLFQHLVAHLALLCDFGLTICFLGCLLFHLRPCSLQDLPVHCALFLEFLLPLGLTELHLFVEVLSDLLLLGIVSVAFPFALVLRQQRVVLLDFSPLVNADLAGAFDLVSPPLNDDAVAVGLQSDNGWNSSLIADRVAHALRSTHGVRFV